MIKFDEISVGTDFLIAKSTKGDLYQWTPNE